jgi:hypothetical protein
VGEFADSAARKRFSAGHGFAIDVRVNPRMPHGMSGFGLLVLRHRLGTGTFEALPEKPVFRTLAQASHPDGLKYSNRLYACP